MTYVDSHWSARSAPTQREVGRSPCTTSQSSLTLTLGVNSQHRHTSIDIGCTTSEWPGGVGPYLIVPVLGRIAQVLEVIGWSCGILRSGVTSACHGRSSQGTFGIGRLYCDRQILLPSSRGLVPA
jgi:hypothetical protein